MEIEIVQGSNLINPGTINSYSILRIPAYWCILEYLSSNMASFPASIYRDELAIDEAHPLDKILSRKANPTTTTTAFLKQLVWDGEHYGNGYALIQRDPVTSDTIGLWNLENATITPFRLTPDDGSLFDQQVWYWHAPSKKAIPQADIIHYRPQGSYDGLIGYSPAMLFAPTFNRASLLEVFQTKFLQRGTLVRGSIELPQGTDKKQAEEIVNTIRSFRASTGDRDLIVLSGGAKLTNTTISPVDAQLSEQDAALNKRFCQIKGVPPSAIYENTEQKYNAASVEAQGQDVVRFTFRARLENLEDELSTKALSEADQDAGYTIRFDTSALLRGDTAVETTVAAQLANQGLATVDEARSTINLPALPDGTGEVVRVPTAVASNPGQTESETHSAEPAPDHYSALRPLLDAAADRVESKTEKALSTASKKPEAERTIAVNVLAEQQQSYCVDAMQPIADTILKITGRTIDISAIAERYGAEIRRRAAGQEQRSLIELMGDTNVAA